MKAQLAVFQERIDATPIRQRTLLFVAALAVLWVFAELLFLGPLATEQGKLQRQLSATQAALTTQQTEYDALTAQIRSNSDSPQQLRIRALQQQVADLQTELSALAGGMVDAADLPRILEDVLVKTGTLTLLELNALPVEELQLASADNGKPLSAGIYKNPVRLRLEGRFFDVIAYLQALEALPWDFNWDELDYRVTRYPYAEVELQVYTLTTEEGMFGA